MKSSAQSFGWSEDFDESLNFWFWLRRTEGIDDAGLLERLNQWVGEASIRVKQLQRSSYERHLQVRDHSRRPDYLPIWRDWKATQSKRHVEHLRVQKPADVHAYYKAMAALGVKVHVQWVMAAFGERWLFPPDLAVMGVEGATAESRRRAVLEAARALTGS